MPPLNRDREGIPAPDRSGIWSRQIADFYRQFLGREAAPDEIEHWLSTGLSLSAISDAIAQSEEARARQATPVPVPAPMPGDRAGGIPQLPASPVGPIGALTPAGVGQGLLKPFTQTFTPPPEPTGPPAWLPEIPVFTPPAFRQAPAFQAPTVEQALRDPGYQFAAQEGQAALERSAAARGVLGTGGTLKDILAWGGNYAQQRYNDVFNRALQSYGTNYQTQYLDPYQASYKSAWDAFLPQLETYAPRSQATQRAGELAYNRAWDQYMFDYDRFRTQNQDVWNRAFQLQSLI
jgi:hypothetical protein